ncbi:MAG: hypothetical protein AAF228_08925 [Pseudomonadota bacterium]
MNTATSRSQAGSQNGLQFSQKNFRKYAETHISQKVNFSSDARKLVELLPEDISPNEYNNIISIIRHNQYFSEQLEQFEKLFGSSSEPVTQKKSSAVASSQTHRTANISTTPQGSPKHSHTTIQTRSAVVRRHHTERMKMAKNLRAWLGKEERSRIEQTNALMLKILQDIGAIVQRVNTILVDANKLCSKYQGERVAMSQKLRANLKKQMDQLHASCEKDRQKSIKLGLERKKEVEHILTSDF